MKWNENWIAIHNDLSLHEVPINKYFILILCFHKGTERKFTA